MEPSRSTDVPTERIGWREILLAIVLPMALCPFVAFPLVPLVAVALAPATRRGSLLAGYFAVLPFLAWQAGDAVRAHYASGMRVDAPVAPLLAPVLAGLAALVLSRVVLPGWVSWTVLLLAALGAIAVVWAAPPIPAEDLPQMSPTMGRLMLGENGLRHGSARRSFDGALGLSVLLVLSIGALAVYRRRCGALHPRLAFLERSDHALGLAAVTLAAGVVPYAVDLGLRAVAMHGGE